MGRSCTAYTHEQAPHQCDGNAGQGWCPVYSSSELLSRESSELSSLTCTRTAGGLCRWPPHGQLLPVRYARISSYSMLDVSRPRGAAAASHSVMSHGQPASCNHRTLAVAPPSNVALMARRDLNAATGTAASQAHPCSRKRCMTPRPRRLAAERIMSAVKLMPRLRCSHRNSRRTKLSSNFRR